MIVLNINTTDEFISTVEVKRNGKYGAASGYSKGFPFLLVLKALIKSMRRK
jgi:hypothetical protein